jgi:hypothetical protein
LGVTVLGLEISMDPYLESVLKDFVIKGLIIGVIGGAILTYCNENLNVLRTSFLIASARRKLKSGNPQNIKRGVQILLEIAIVKPFRRQEMVDFIVSDCLRRYFGRENLPAEPTPPPMVEVFVDTLRAVLNIPRKDENGHLLNIDLHQLRLISADVTVYLEQMNFSNVVLWGCDFVRVDLSRSTFETADLGGTYFKQCGLEFAVLDKAKLCYSVFDKRPTTIEETGLVGSTLDKAMILDYGSPTPQLPALQLQIINSDLEPWMADKLKGKSGVKIF